MTMSVVPDVGDGPSIKGLVRDKRGRDNVGGEITNDSYNGDVPMHRYMADVQPYEWLAVALECQAEPSQQVGAATKDPKKTGSTITLSNGSGLAALEEGEDPTAIPQTEEMMRLRVYVGEGPVTSPLTCTDTFAPTATSGSEQRL